MLPIDVAYSIRRALVINDLNGGPQTSLGAALIPNYTNYDNGPEVGGIIPQDVINSSVTYNDTAWTVTFHLVAPCAPFLAYLTYTVASVVEMRYVEEHTPGGDTPGSDNTWMDDHVMGTGPYVLEQWDLNQFVLLNSYQGYWGGPDHAGPAKVKQVLIENVQSESTMEMLLRSGAADFATLNPTSWNGLLTDKDLTVFQGEPTFNVDYIGMNENITPSSEVSPGNIPDNFFQDVHVRLAFEAAFDYNNYINNIAMGNAERINGPIPVGMFGYNESVPYYSYDLNMVRSELLNASDPNGGNYWDNGFTLNFYVVSGSALRVEAALMLKDTMENLSGGHIHINVIETDYNTVIDDTLEGYLPISFCGWDPDYNDPYDFVLNSLASYGTWGPAMDIHNVTLDALISSSVTVSDPSQRAELYYEIEMSAYQNAYYIWTGQSLTYHAQRSWVQGYYYNPMIYDLYYYSMWK